MRSAILAGLVLLLVLPLAAHGLSYSALIARPPSVTDVHGNGVADLEAGQQVMLTVTFSSQLESEQPYVGIIEVRDSQDVTVYLALQSGVIGPGASSTIGSSWTAEAPSTYHLRSFAITDLQEPQILSAIASTEVTAR